MESHKINTQMQHCVIHSLTDIMESRDADTGGHVRRTRDVVRLLTDAMMEDPNVSLTEQFRQALIDSASMHDLGKMEIEDRILQKPGRLTKEEFEIIKTHPVRSANLIQKALLGKTDEEFLKTAVNTARYHHEKMDGTGYPDGLRGKEIPLEARIMAIADVYDALVSKRSYKEPMSFEQAFQVIEEGMGNHFDPDLNPCFLAARGKIEAYYRAAHSRKQKQNRMHSS